MSELDPRIVAWLARANDLAAHPNETAEEWASRLCECDDNEAAECCGPVRCSVMGSLLVGNTVCPCPHHANMPRTEWTTTVTSTDGATWDARPVVKLKGGGVTATVRVEGWNVTMDFDAAGNCGDFRCDVAALRALLS